MKGLSDLQVLGLQFLGSYALTGSVLFVVAFSSNASVLGQMNALRTSGLETTGTVLNLQPHNGVCYSYVVGASAYTGCHDANYPGEHAATLTVGQQIHVVYDRNDPSLSCACQPGPEYASRAVGPFALAVLGGFGPALIASLELRKRRRMRNSVTPSDGLRNAPEQSRT